MNLVAKEFVAARDDEQGVLMLSQFAGASRELPEALVVNPYDADQCAAALARRAHDARRRAARAHAAHAGRRREFNVYRWAGRMLMDAARTRKRQRLIERSMHLMPDRRGTRCPAEEPAGESRAERTWRISSTSMER